MSVSVLLTTYNRPRLLAQALPQIEREAESIGATLYIADDSSDDEQTLDLIGGAWDRGATILRPQPQYGLHPALSIQRRFLSALDRIDTDFFIKVDDDIVLRPGTFGRMVEGWDALVARGRKVAALGGMIDAGTTPLDEVAPGIVLTGWASSPCAMHRTDLWKRCRSDLGDHAITIRGWDCAFFWNWLNRRADGSCYSLTPSGVYHAGFLGAHMAGRDVNRQPPDPHAYPGEWLEGKPKGVVIDTGSASDWTARYGIRMSLDL